MLRLPILIASLEPLEPLFSGNLLAVIEEFIFAQEFALAQEYGYLDELEIRPDEDRACYAIALYIANGLNHLLERFDKTCVAVRDIEQYDAVNPDLSRFPLLKCYRTVESFPDETSRDVNAVVAYCLTFPQQNKLGPVLQWISGAINRMLRQYARRHQGCPVELKLEDVYKAEYRIMVNEVATPVYAFLRFNISFTETLN
jgi:hypothetical protein